MFVLCKYCRHNECLSDNYFLWINGIYRMSAGGRMIILNVVMLHSGWRYGQESRGVMSAPAGLVARTLVDETPQGRAAASIADGLLGRDPVQPGHATAHSAQSQMSVLAQDRGDLIGQPVDHE
jgi:hypothetical protein